MMNEKVTHQELSSVNDSSQSHLASLKKRKVTVIKEENGLDALQDEDLLSSVVVDAEENLLTSEQIKEFFKATEEGSVERLDALFDKATIFEPNMTEFTESLLMAAIRAKQRKVAEYLIDQSGINVDHSTELLEFNTRAKIPIRERTLSSRDLAYDEGMMDLVDLIDIVGNELKPSTKRYLQRRLTRFLDVIHQAYVTRMKERNDLLLIRSEEKIIEETPTENITFDNIDLPSSLPPPPPPLPVVDRSYKSNIEETIQSIQSSNDKSIDESGKKYFRFSGYTVRYRLVETTNINKHIQEQSGPKIGRHSLPTITRTTSSLLPSSFSRSRTATTTPYFHSHSLSEISTQIPIRETRTSICRSARQRAASRLSSTVNAENKSDVKPRIKTAINAIPRLLPKRTQQINSNYGYIPQQQPAIYNEPRRFIPVTLKSTAFGLPSDTPLIRD